MNTTATTMKNLGLNSRQLTWWVRSASPRSVSSTRDAPCTNRVKSEWYPYVERFRSCVGVIPRSSGRRVVLGPDRRRDRRDASPFRRLPAHLRGVRRGRGGRGV